MRRSRVGIPHLLCCTLLLAAAGDAHAQLPGGPGVDVDRQRADFLNVSLHRVRLQVGEWLAAWRGETREPFDAHYADLATLIPPGGAPVQGREQLAAFGAAAVPVTSDANLTITDFDASEGIAYLFGSYTFIPLHAGEPLSAGQHVTMLQRDGGRWRIRAQLYRPEAGSAPWPPRDADFAHAAAGALATPVAASAASTARHEALTALAALSGAWAAGDDATAAAHFSRDALLYLPDHVQPARGPQIQATLRAAIDSFAALRTAVIDLGQAERLSWMVARYYLEPRNGPARSGYLMLVLAGPPGRRQVRSLVFTTPLESTATAPAAAGALDARRLETRADSLFGNTRCAVSALRAGQPLFERGWGGAAPGSAATTPALTSYVARATAAALIRRGALSPDDDVRRWLPELPVYERPVLVRHLLERTSGLRDVDALLALAGRTGTAIDDAGILALLARQRAPDTPPGSERRASRTDDALLAVLVARAAGGGFEEVADWELLQPLGMAETTVSDDGSVRTTLADLTRLLHAIREQRAELPDALVADETIAIVPGADAAVAALCTAPVPGLAARAATLAAALDGRAHVAPAPAATATPTPAAPAAPAALAAPTGRHDAATVAAWQGIYFSDELGVHWRFAPLAGALVLFREGAPPQPLARTGDGAFTFDGWTVRREAGTGGAELHVTGAGVRRLVLTTAATTAP